MAKEKNVDLLLEGQKRINEKDKNIKLLMVGDGPDLDEYKETAKKLGIDKNVIFAGKVPWEDVPKYYRLADIFATASTSETQGITYIEALACGLPLVCRYDKCGRWSHA